MPLCLALRGFPAIRVLGGIMIGGWIIRLLAARRQDRAASTASHRHGKSPAGSSNGGALGTAPSRCRLAAGTVPIPRNATALGKVPSLKNSGRRNGREGAPRLTIPPSRIRRDQAGGGGIGNQLADYLPSGLRGLGGIPLSPGLQTGLVSLPILLRHRHLFAVDAADHLDVGLRLGHGCCRAHRFALGRSRAASAPSSCRRRDRQTKLLGRGLGAPPCRVPREPCAYRNRAKRGAGSA